MFDNSRGKNTFFDFSVSPSPLVTDWVFELGLTGLGLGLGGLGTKGLGLGLDN